MTAENYRANGEPRAFYYAEYRATYQRYCHLLQFGEPIPQDMLVSLIGHNTVIPSNFDLRKSDREPLGSFLSPGKSAHVAFTTSLMTTCRAIMDRPAREHDHLYMFPAGSIQEAHFHAYYLPYPNLPLHVLLVHQDHLTHPSLRDISYRDKVALADILNRYKQA